LGGLNIQDLLSNLNNGGNIRDVIRGVIAGGDLGALLDGGRTTVSLVPVGSAGRGGWSQSSGRPTVNEEGAFQIVGVTPGPYNLVATARTEAGQTTAMQRVDVASGGNVSGLSLQLRPGMTVSGQIYVDGTPAENFSPQSLRVQIQLVDDLPFGGNISAQVGADGAFQLENVVPGAQYRVTLNSVSGSYLLAGRYGGANALSAPFVATDSVGSLQLQIGFGPGRLETVIKNGDKPVPGALAVLIPSDRGRYDLYRTANSDKDGKIAFANVTPGDYKVFAWEEIQQGAWQDPYVMEKYEDRGRPVHIDKAGALKEEVQIVRSEMRL
jgi:hypothetical protein